MEQSTKVLSEVAGRTNSELILFLIIVAVLSIAAMFVLVPALTKRQVSKIQAETAKFNAESNAESESFKRWTEREKQLIDVIQKNTEAWAKMATVLDANNKNCNECRTDQAQLWRDVITKQDEILIILRKGHAI